MNHNGRLIRKEFNQLSVEELYEILRVRSEVFVVEQECIYQDLDGIDRNSIHVFYEEEGKIKAYLRIFWKDKEQKVVQIGRVLTTERGVGLGEKILLEGIKAAEETMGAEIIYIEAQCYAIGFYEKAGFQVTSEEFLEDGIPHVEMRRLKIKGYRMMRDLERF